MTLFLIDILAEVSERTRLNLAMPSINYMYAPVIETIETISAMTKNANLSARKYPFVSIITDIKETKGERSDMQSHVVLPMVVFACLTRPEKMTKKRYDDSFRDVLQPLYEMWIDQLGRHNDIYVPDMALTRHTKTDRLSWGRSQVWANNGKSIDFIDAIEVNDLEFWIRKKNC